MSDPVADMFTRIRNASLAGAQEVVVPYSRFKQDIAKILKKEGYISEIRKFKEKGSVRQFLALKNPVVSHIRRLSKPGQRWYSSWKRIENPNAGVRIVSTPQGVMTHSEAKRRKLGGEVVGEVW
ncbi:30S ribosomal protein S8 [Candidatus Saccharibacteria bacterium]|nr:30S ribosomal protein S8 [Candidatus Saccharibacteria bacterium]